MKKISVKKINLNFHLKLKPVLWILFIVVIVFESWILYSSLYANFQKFNESELVLEPKVLNYDHQTFVRALERIQQSELFVLPQTTLRQDSLGRENPFAEY